MVYIIIVIFVCIAIYFFYNNSKPQKIISIPKTWHNLLLKHVMFYSKLSPEEQLQFQENMRMFLMQTRIEAVGFKIEELDTVFVTASAVIPVFCFDDWEYTNLSTVLIYPDNFNANLEFEGEGRNIAGLVGTGRFDNQMILSRKALHHGFSNKTDKGNTAIHEFIHLIDKLDGDVDGIPKILLSNTYAIPWLNLVHEKMEAINNNTSDIRNYGGTNQQEFFAVASEYFFERPKLFRRKHPELYKMMSDCFCKKAK
ncbi:M90 family metallopeptidase [uncultured Algibacter sp.]|uniref:M90 family metallopeptidase n=1 Tax=uncultured Algibacter sp. TaxID=298659 RepID=UPI00321716F1